MAIYLPVRVCRNLKCKKRYVEDMNAHQYLKHLCPTCHDITLIQETFRRKPTKD